MKNVLSISMLLLAFSSSFAQQKKELYFDFDKSQVNTASLNDLNTWISSHPHLKIEKIYGFCDAQGTNKYNDTLALRRVKTVFNYLKENHVPFDNEYVQQGFGENFLQDKNQSLNRKVEIIYSNLEPESIKNPQELVPIPVATFQEETLDTQVKMALKGDLIRLKNINFFNNSAVILPKSNVTLRELLRILQENLNLKIQIQGHICCQTSNKMDHISKARAKAIYTYLIAHKIKSNRLSYKGFGVSNPIYPIPEKSPFEQEENRRVALKIIEN